MHVILTTSVSEWLTRYKHSASAILSLASAAAANPVYCNTIL